MREPSISMLLELAHSPRRTVSSTCSFDTSSAAEEVRPKSTRGVLDAVVDEYPVDLGVDEVEPGPRRGGPRHRSAATLPSASFMMKTRSRTSGMCRFLISLASPGPISSSNWFGGVFDDDVDSTARSPCVEPPLLVSLRLAAAGCVGMTVRRMRVIRRHPERVIISSEPAMMVVVARGALLSTRTGIALDSLLDPRAANSNPRDPRGPSRAARRSLDRRASRRQAHAVSTGALIALALVLFGWAVVSERFAARNLTGPLVFFVAGLLLANPSGGSSTSTSRLDGPPPGRVDAGLLLFADASRVPLAAARHDLPLTARLLGIGLPLSIVAGTALALRAVPEHPARPRRPDRRQPGADRRRAQRLGDRRRAPAESLSDGAQRREWAERRHRHASGDVLHRVGGDRARLGRPPRSRPVRCAGAAGYRRRHRRGIALVGGRLLRLAHRRGWMEHGSRRLATLALALFAFQVASEAGGNPFVSAFVGGLVFGATAGSDTVESCRARRVGRQSALAGPVVRFRCRVRDPRLRAPRRPRRASTPCAVSRSCGWSPVAHRAARRRAGPSHDAVHRLVRPPGLASVVFGLLAVEELGDSDPRVAAAVHAIAITIVFSIVAHGISARPLAARVMSRSIAATLSRASIWSPWFSTSRTTVTRSAASGTVAGLR